MLITQRQPRTRILVFHVWKAAEPYRLSQNLIISCVHYTTRK